MAQKVLLSSTTATTTSDLHLIINAVGKDRLGIVSDVTGMVIAAGGNVGDSQAAKLGSHFSLMMEMSIPKDNLDALKQRIGSMPGMNAAVYEDEVQDTVQTPQIGCKLFTQDEGGKLILLIMTSQNTCRLTH